MNHGDFKGLRHLADTEPGRFVRGFVLYAGREMVPFGDQLWAMPLSMWWGRARVAGKPLKSKRA